MSLQHATNTLMVVERKSFNSRVLIGCLLMIMLMNFTGATEEQLNNGHKNMMDSKRSNLRFYSHKQMMKEPNDVPLRHVSIDINENRNAKIIKKERSINENMKYVNPFIGTGGRAFGSGTMSPMAQTPFGMIRVGPDTTNMLDLEVSFEHPGGFYYPDDYITCFSHTHLVGAGVPDMGNIGIMPVSLYKEELTYDFLLPDKKASSYDKENQLAQPGYYRVNLDRYNIMAELTSGIYSGIHRYTFNDKAKESFIILDISHTIDKKTCKEATIGFNKETQLFEGSLLNSGKLSGRGFYLDNLNGGVRIFYVIKLVNCTIDEVGMWNDKEIVHDLNVTSSIAGSFVKVSMKNSQTMSVYIAISYISIEQARRNLEQETGVLSQTNIVTFDQLKDRNQQMWTKVLNKIQVNSQHTSEENHIKFFTALYQASMAPTTLSEAGGVFRGFDNKIHTLEPTQKAFYTDMSIWDVHRTQFPLIGFLESSRMEDIVLSMMQVNEQVGFLPKWPFCYGEAGSMVGNHANVIITEAFLKGQLSPQKIDIRKAYQAMKKTSDEPVNYVGRVNPVQYNQLGFVPEESAKVGAVLTLDYSYDDACIASIAKVLNETVDFLNFTARSKFYKNVWNQMEQFFCPKSTSGKWNCPEITFADGWDSRYVEGDAWHYRFFVPHDIPGLIQLFGSKEKFVSALEQFGRDSFLFSFTFLPNPYYWGGNEHDLMSMYLFNYADRPDLTQYYVRQMMDRLYTVNPDGLPGNNDYGTMSAWFVWSALGLYPRAGSTEYFVGSPLFENIQVQRDDNCALTIISHNFKQDSPHIEKVLLNGQDLRRPFIEHSQLNCENGVDNVKLEFYFA